MPPEPLVAWTQYVALVVTVITGVRALLKAGTLANLQIKKLRG